MKKAIMNKLEIDEQSEEQEESNSKSKQKGRGKKRKRQASESSTDGEITLPENTLEVEKNLHASAIKNNLDDVSVKKILKKVVTNDHVLALVKLREEEEESSTEENLRPPKLTRAKAKELMKVSPKSAPWNLELTPIKHIPVKTRPEVKALIAQELPEDEDDEEYEPTQEDVPSDDDHMIESSSDVDSLPRTPATPRSERKTPNVVSDGPFKIPQQELPNPARRKLVLQEEEATIALRTRSKLSLSATSIEHIESSFVPPDDLPMPDVDSLWNEFLKDCLNPASNARNEDDDETDPEYSVAADPDAHDEDEESLENSIIKISKKELNDLVTELFSIIPDGTTEQLADNMMQEVLTQQNTTEVPPRWEGKTEPASDEETTTKTTNDSSNICTPLQITIKRDSTTRVSIGKSEPEDQDNDELENAPEKNENNSESRENEPMDVSNENDEMEKNRRKSIQNEPNKENLPASAQPPVSHANDVVMRIHIDSQEPAVLRAMPKAAPVEETVKIVITEKQVVLAEQRRLLQQQLRQHAQLAAGSFLQLCVHPEHWQRAPTFKEYLTSLYKIAEKNPSSVVNVCNLKPAVELVASWEESVSKDSPENIKMVEFLQKEIERSRRRMAQNALYTGDFPEMFMKVVANSNVFLYPYLLPAMPYRPDQTQRKFSYLRSEDALIILGLDQFWDYVTNNPALFKRPTTHARHRWGLAASARLVSRHMLPWIDAKKLLSHISSCRKANDPDNLIVKYFKSRTIEPPKHTLLPFNPQLTLYEQPEHEMPRVWLRYLAKGSKRFQKFLRQQKGHIYGQPPAGVDVVPIYEEPLHKAPLPIDFSKEINCNRLNVKPPKTQPPLVNRLDVPINYVSNTNSSLAPTNIFTVVNTSIGSYLIPVKVQTMTVNSNVTPVTTPIQADNSDQCNDKDSEDVESTTAEKADVRKTSNVEAKKDSEHCPCCVLLRKICKVKQKTIEDYFQPPTRRKKCECLERRYPKISNRLKLLVNNFKVNSQSIYRKLLHKIKLLKKENGTVRSRTKCCDVISDDCEESDMAIATSFQLKMVMRATVVKDYLVKRRLYALFSKFDVEGGDVLLLAADMEKICNVEMVDIYKEFVGFLTAEQADVLGQYKDYFVQQCEAKLAAKIEESVTNRHKQIEMLEYLSSKFNSNYFNKWSSCDICTELLTLMDGYPDLARYVFSLFPHRRTKRPKEITPEKVFETNTTEPQVSETSDHSEPTDDKDSVTLVYEAFEADQSSSGEESEEMNKDDGRESPEQEAVIHPQDIVLKQEPEPIDMPTKTTEASTNASDRPSSVMSAETRVKTEPPEWKRDEDKIILEILKQHVTPKELRSEAIVIEGTSVLQMITESLSHKSIDEIRERVSYLLELLVKCNVL